VSCESAIPTVQTGIELPYPSMIFIDPPRRLASGALNILSLPETPRFDGRGRNAAFERRYCYSRTVRRSPRAQYWSKNFQQPTRRNAS